MHSDDKSMVGLLLAWIGNLLGALTLSNAVLGLTLVYTILQIFLTIKRIRRMDRERTTFF